MSVLRGALVSLERVKKGIGEPFVILLHGAGCLGAKRERRDRGSCRGVEGCRSKMKGRRNRWLAIWEAGASCWFCRYTEGASGTETSLGASHGAFRSDITQSHLKGNSV